MEGNVTFWRSVNERTELVAGRSQVNTGFCDINLSLLVFPDPIDPGQKKGATKSAFFVCAAAKGNVDPPLHL
jgi:hypothetical protein